MEYEYEIINNNSIKIIHCLGDNMSYYIPDTRVIIPETINNYPVISIGTCAFSNCHYLKEIILSQSIKYIESRAFEGRTIEFITLNEGLLFIGNEAFSSCYYLKNIQLPKSMKKIGQSVWSTCTNLESIEISSENGYYTTIDGVLYNKECTKLIKYPSKKKDKEYKIPDSVQSIESGAFSHTCYLESIILSNHLTIIKDAAFQSSNIKYIHLPSQLKRIGKYAFAYSSLVSIDIPDNVETIGERAFESCISLKKVTGLSGLKEISKNMFSKCTSLNSVYIHEGPTTIAENAFLFCVHLKDVQLPSSLQSIGENAFYECRELASLILPETITSINNDAFYRCFILKLMVYQDSYALKYCKDNQLPFEINFRS